MSCLFEGCSSLESFDASRLDTGNVTDMSRLFSGCSSLESFDASRLDTGNVTDMSGLFSGCSSLRSVNLSKLNTSRVKTMAAMFSGCSSLKKLDLSRFDTSRVKNIAGIFYGCTSLESVDLAGFDTSDLSQYVYTEEERAELSASSMGAQSVASDSQKPIGAASLSAQSALSAQTSTTYTDIFKGCKKLKKVTVGKGFAFKHATLRLPAQSASSVAGANGKWYTVAGKGYTPAKVPSKKAATYYAVAPITAATIIGVKNLAYTGGKLTQNPVVKVSGKKLKRGKDYKVSYANNRKVGTATMTIIGIGNRIGSKKVKFKITKGKLKGVKVVLSKASVKYNKKVQKPAVKTVGGKKLKAGRDYTLKFSKAKPKAPGAYKIWVVGKGNYAGTSAKATYKITKAANTMDVAAKTAMVKYSKKKASTVKAAKAYNFKKAAVGKVTYKRIAKGSSKNLPKVNAKNGAITVKKGAKKGTYKVKVKITAKGNANYKSSTKTVTVKVKVK